MRLKRDKSNIYFYTYFYNILLYYTFEKENLLTLYIY